MNIPKGYKQTELGIIPEDWEVKHISDFTSIVTGGTPSTQHPEYWGGDIRWMSSGELNHKFIHDVEGRITQEGLDNSSTHIIPAGCVLIGLAGQGKTRGTAAYNFVSLCTNQSIAAFLPTAEHSSLYLYYVIDCKYEYLRLLSSGDGGRGGLNKKLLSSLNVVIPPLSEQKAIAKALNDVDDLIAALDKKIAKKRLVKQGAMQQLLTGKKRLPGFTEEWILTTLSQLGRFISGNGFPICFQGCKSEKYPFFKVSDFNNKGNELSLATANNYISESIKDKLCCNIIPKKSVVFAKIGAAIFLERKRLCDVDCCIDNNMMAFNPNTDTDANFICFLLQSFSFGDLVEATALPSLGARTVGNIILYIPKNIKEQQSIAAILSDMDKEIASLEKQRDNYCLLKSGMMQKLLTGQIRLK